MHLRILKIAAAVLAVMVGHVQAVRAQQSYNTPEDAGRALIASVKSNDRRTLTRVLGKLGNDADLQTLGLVQTLEQQDPNAPRIERQGEDKAYLVGDGDNRFAIRLIRQDGRWKFDATAARNNILRERIARNEAKAIEASSAYFDAQTQYLKLNPKLAVTGYAKQVLSSPGQHNGLYWPAKDHDTESPLTEELARGLANRGVDGLGRSPYHGYYFKVLSRQGNHAPGGQFHYLENGNLVRGFALIAYPAHYGYSGVMTFQINQDGVVYQKDLGSFGTRSADREIWFNPDQTWRSVSAPKNSVLKERSSP